MTKRPLQVFADARGMEEKAMLAALKKTVFKTENVSNEEAAVFLIVANKYGLDPFTNEIYAMVSKGRIIPYVSVDGALKVANSNKEHNGMSFTYSDTTDKDGTPAWIECHIYKKGKDHPITAREYYSECKRDTQPWKQMPMRQLRNKVIRQAVRVAYSLSGLDEDEAQDVVLNEIDVAPGDATQKRLEAIKTELKEAQEDAIEENQIRDAIKEMPKLVSKEQIAELTDRVRVVAADLDAMLKNYKVDAIAKLNEAQFTDAIHKLKDRPMVEQPAVTEGDIPA